MQAAEAKAPTTSVLACGNDTAQTPCMGRHSHISLSLHHISCIEFCSLNYVYAHVYNALVI